MHASQKSCVAVAVDSDARENLRRLIEGPGDPYLIPGTDCLRNKLGATDALTLHDAEAEHVLARLVILNQRPPAGRLDDIHVRAIHRALFKNVYDWAGRYRQIAISKGGYQFASPENIAASLRRICLRHLGDLSTATSHPKAFAEELTRFFSDVNDIHPFRDGNGRTQEFYFSLVVEKLGRSLDWSLITKDQMDAACIASHDGDLGRLRELFSVAVSDRARRVEQTPIRTIGRGARSR
jgi:cell filamentation protein